MAPLPVRATALRFAIASAVTMATLSFAASAGRSALSATSRTMRRQLSPAFTSDALGRMSSWSGVSSSDRVVGVPNDVRAPPPLSGPTSTSLRAYTNRPTNGAAAPKELDPMETLSGYSRPKVNWYPGHIAKAERQLSETLKSVDVVIEVRDARLPKASAHPSVGKWAAGRPRVVVLTRMDTVTGRSRESWGAAYDAFGADKWEEELGGDALNRNAQNRRERNKYNVVTEGQGQVEEVLFVDAKRGKGTHAIARAVHRAGKHVNERRKHRGLNDRPLRVGIIGFPNVGKSALINRLLGRKRARTANTPGITRSLQWIRVAADKTTKSSGAGSGSDKGDRGFELLDSPGIIPADMLDQTDALLLAACNSIGVGAYDNQAVAAYLCDRIQSLVLMDKASFAAPLWREKCVERYGFDPLLKLSEQNIAARWGTKPGETSWVAHAATNDDRIPTGEDMLFIIADKTCRGDPETAARKILQDFRSLRMGPIALQLAPESERDRGQLRIKDGRGDGLGAFTNGMYRSPEERNRAEVEERQKEKTKVEVRARAAMEAAKERGLELPPVVESMIGGGSGESDNLESASDTDSKVDESEVGKGLFDGW